MVCDVSKVKGQTENMSGIKTLLPAVSLRMTFSLSIVVVATCGPGELPFSFPNFAHCLRSATACSPTAFWIFFRIFFVT